MELRQGLQRGLKHVWLGGSGGLQAHRVYSSMGERERGMGREGIKGRGKERGGWGEKELRGGGNGERTSEKKCKNCTNNINTANTVLEHCWSE